MPEVRVRENENIESALKRFKKKIQQHWRQKSRRPKHFRDVQYSAEIVTIIRKIRKEYPSFSAVKISVLLLRDYVIMISAATIGRIIKKYNVFFSRLTRLHKDHSKAGKRSWQTRKARERTTTVCQTIYA